MPAANVLHAYHFNYSKNKEITEVYGLLMQRVTRREYHSE
jgi:hypothetical protein